MEHKKQHYIPQSYLSAWTDPQTPADQEPYVWLVDKKSLEIRNRAPRNIMFERNLYTIVAEDGGRDLSLERLLSMIEGEFVRVRDHVILSGRPLGRADRYAIIAFVSAMHSRTPASGERLSPIWNDALALMKKMTAWAESASPEELASAALAPAIGAENSFAVSVEEVQSIVDSPVPSLLVPSIMAEIDALKILDLAILETVTIPGFITSDNPVVWFDPEGYKRKWPHQGPALMYPSIEISMPITPKYSILLNRQGINGYVTLADQGPLAEAQVVNAANWRVQITAQEAFVVARKRILWKWVVPS